MKTADNFGKFRVKEIVLTNQGGMEIRCAPEAILGFNRDTEYNVYFGASGERGTERPAAAQKRRSAKSSRGKGLIAPAKGGTGPGQNKCSVCGGAINASNKTGVCSRTKACIATNARMRYQKAHPGAKSRTGEGEGDKEESSSEPSPAARTCGVCGRPINANNKIGICRETLECRKAIKNYLARKLAECALCEKMFYSYDPENHICPDCRRNNKTGAEA